LIVNIPYAL